MVERGRDIEIKPLLVPPRLRTLEGGDGRRASYLELFFDLVFVVAIAQLAHELVLDHSLAGFGVFGALYLPVFIAWQGFSFYADRFDTDDVVFRVVMFTAMLVIAALAIQIPDVAHGKSTGFVLAYVLLRSLMVGLYLRSYRHVAEARPLTGRYAWGYSIGITVWLLSLAFDPPARYVLWGVALAWEFSMPTLARRLFAAIPVHASHVPERFALFTIIVLGETIVVVALGTAGSEWRLSAALVAVFGFVVAAAIWWVYFGAGNEVTLSHSPAAIIAFTQRAHSSPRSTDGRQCRDCARDRRCVVRPPRCGFSLGARRGSGRLSPVRHRRSARDGTRAAAENDPRSHDGSRSTRCACARRRADGPGSLRSAHCSRARTPRRLQAVGGAADPDDVARVTTVAMRRVVLEEVTVAS